MLDTNCIQNGRGLKSFSRSLTKFGSIKKEGNYGSQDEGVIITGGQEGSIAPMLHVKL